MVPSCWIIPCYCDSGTGYSPSESAGSTEVRRAFEALETRLLLGMTCTGWKEGLQGGPNEIQPSSNNHSPAEGMQLYPLWPPLSPIERGPQAGSGESEHHCPAWIMASNTFLMWLFCSGQALGMVQVSALPRDPSQNAGWRMSVSLGRRAELYRLRLGDQKSPSLSINAGVTWRVAEQLEFWFFST